MRVTAGGFDNGAGFLFLGRLLRQRAGISRELDRRRRCLYDWWLLCQRSIKSSRAQADNVVHAELFFDPQTHTARGVVLSAGDLRLVWNGHHSRAASFTVR